MGNGAENQTVAPGAFRLREFVKRAAAGEELTIAFFGGSITQGSLASEERWCYAHRTFDLLKERYPQAALHYLNAGIGGTGSHYGVMRLWPDLLMYHPDLVVVDFSVNDTEAVLPLYTGDPGSAEAGAPIAHHARSSSFDKIYPETFEAVIRRVLSAEGAPAMIILNNAFYDTGESVEEEHNAIADHYGVPHVSVRDTILPRIRAGEFTREDLSPDGLHPNDRGHALIAEEILKVIPDASEAAGISTPEGAFPAPIVGDGYARLMRYDITNCAPVLSGFLADGEKPQNPWDFFRHGWIGRRIGDRLSVRLSGRNLAVVYRKSIHRPTPVARLILDGDVSHAVMLDGNFDQDWGDCLFLQPVLHHGSPGDHTLEIEIVQATDGDQSPFYLLSFGADARTGDPSLSDGNL